MILLYEQSGQSPEIDKIKEKVFGKNKILPNIILNELHGLDKKSIFDSFMDARMTLEAEEKIKLFE